jgi:WD40 repeat protein/serine/threonine protein kinase
MNDCDAHDDDDLASMLSACDEALAAGDTSVINKGNGAPGDQARLLKDLDCIRLLRQVWPGHATNGKSIPSVTEIPERLGRFRIERELGRGGFGIVYLAFDPQLARTVALKVPRPDVLSTAQLRERFRHEARAAAALDHPNIVAVHETGEIDCVAYIAAAHCRGVTLNKWMSEYPNGVPFIFAATLTAQLADGVSHAHHRGILHRDLKPANVMVDTGNSAANIEIHESISDTAATIGPLPTVKITDFGLARFLNKTDFSLTVTGAILGTPNYLAPEQAAASSSAPEKGDKNGIGPAVDVYGLGTILYEMLTGRAPFVADNALETLRQVRSEDPIAPRKLRSQLPRDLETICLKCLEKEPSHRYKSANDLAADLRRFIQGEPILARPPGWPERSAKWVRRRPAVAALIASVVAVATLGFSGVVWQWRQTIDALSQSQKAHNATKAHLYLNQIARARHELVANHVGRAESLLDETPEAARGWEWHFLKRRCQTDLYVMRGNGAPVQSVAYSPDSKLIASGAGDWYTGADGELNIWDAHTGHLIRTITRNGGTVYHVAFHPDSRRLVSASADGKIRLWDVSSGSLLLEMIGHKWRCDCVAFSPDGKQIASGSADQTVRIWDTDSGICLKTLTLHRATILSVAYSPDGKYLVSADRYGVAHLWNAATATPVRSFAGLGDIRAAAFSPDSSWLSFATYFGQIAVIDLLNPHAQTVYHHLNAGPLLSLVYTPNGTLAWSSREGHIRIQNPQTGKDRYVLPGRDGWAYSVAMSPDGRRLVSGGTDGTVRICDATAEDEAARYLDDGSVLPGMMFDPDGHLFALGGVGKRATVWDMTQNKKALSIPGKSNPSAFAGSPSGRSWAWVADDNLLHVRERDGQADLWTRQLTAGPFTGLAYSHDGRWLAWGDVEGIIHLVDAATGNDERALGPQGTAITGVAFHPNGQLIAAAGDDGNFCLWNITTKLVVARFSESGQQEAGATEPNDIKPKSARVTRLSFSPDGRRLAAANPHRPLEIWDVAACRVALIMDFDAEGASSAAWSADGKKLAVALGKRVQVWDATEQSLEARRRATVENELGWHRLETEYGVGRQDWFAAIYHISKVIQADPENPALYIRRGGFHVRYYETGRGSLANAANDFAEALHMNPENQNVWYWHALVTLASGDGKGYQTICRDMFDRFGNTNDAQVANDLAWTCSIGAGAISDPSRIVDLAIRSGMPKKGNANSFNSLAAVHYRAGQYDAALNCLQEAMRLRNQQGDAWDWLLLAMTYHQLHQPDQGQLWLDKATQYLDRVIGDQPAPGAIVTTNWHDRIELALLRKEATALLSGKKPLE